MGVPLVKRQPSHSIHEKPSQPFQGTTGNYPARVPTVLHVDPVIPVVPDTFNTKEVIVNGTVALSCKGVDKEALRHLPLP